MVNMGKRAYWVITMSKQLLFVVVVAAVLCVTGAVGDVTDISAGEVGQYYGRMDLGYSLSAKQEVKGIGLISNGDLSKKYRGSNINLGLGYCISDALRADVTIQRSSLINRGKKILDVGADADADSDVNAVNVYAPFMEIDLLRGMVNVYYDLVMGDSDIIPFITAGVGVDSSLYQVKSASNFVNGGSILVRGASIDDIDDDAGNALNSALSTASGADSGTKVSTLKSAIESNANIVALDSLKFKRKMGFVYQYGIGMSYQMDYGVTLDLSYNLSTVAKHEVSSGDPEVSMNLVRVDFDGAGDPTKDANLDGIEAGGVFKSALKHTVMIGFRAAF